MSMSPSDTEVHIKCNFFLSFSKFIYFSIVSNCLSLFFGGILGRELRGGISGVLNGYYMGLRRVKGVLYWVLCWDVT